MLKSPPDLNHRAWICQVKLSSFRAFMTTCK